MTNELPTLEQVIRATRTSRNQVDSWRRLGLLTEPLERLKGQKGIKVPYRAALEIGLLAAIMAFKAPPTKAGLLMKMWMGRVATAEDGAAFVIDVHSLLNADADITAQYCGAGTEVGGLASAMTGSRAPSWSADRPSGVREPSPADMPPFLCLIFPATIRHQVAALYPEEGGE